MNSTGHFRCCVFHTGPSRLHGNRTITDNQRQLMLYIGWLCGDAANEAYIDGGEN